MNWMIDILSVENIEVCSLTLDYCEPMMGKSVTGTNYAWSFLSQFAEEQSFQKDVVYARFPSNEAFLYAE